MPIKISLGQGDYLTPINAYELTQINDNYLDRCVMCRDKLSEETRSAEHIYPKWLQNQFCLWDKKLRLPNDSTIPYRQMTVPCCKACNGGVMSDWEKHIGNAVSQGYEAFVKLDEEIIAWWVYKLYYTKLVKELSLRTDIKDPESETIITDKLLAEYNPIYYYMCELLKGTKFLDPKPYELYIYRTLPDNGFDYVDDISRHVVYIKMNDILIVCALDSFSFFAEQYERENRGLDALDDVQPLQALELFTKIIYYRAHYKYDTGHSNIITNRGLEIASKIMNPVQQREFRIEELYAMMVSMLRWRGYEGDMPKWREGQMFTLIPGA